jgi:EAL domain-containing protein (putative c-di-GMP-specific phosphodiesterase class I)
LFIETLDKDEKDRAAVTAMVALSRVYGLKTVAEFVHNEAILGIVRALGVDYAQGYVCHMPEPLDNLAQLETAEEKKAREGT